MWTMKSGRLKKVTDADVQRDREDGDTPGLICLRVDEMRSPIAHAVEYAICTSCEARIVHQPNVPDCVVKMCLPCALDTMSDAERATFIQGLVETFSNPLPDELEQLAKKALN